MSCLASALQVTRKMQYPLAWLQLHVESSRAGSPANAFCLNIRETTSLTTSSNSSQTNCTVFCGSKQMIVVFFAFLHNLNIAAWTSQISSSKLPCECQNCSAFYPTESSSLVVHFILLSAKLGSSKFGLGQLLPFPSLQRIVCHPSSFVVELLHFTLVCFSSTIPVFCAW